MAVSVALAGSTLLDTVDHILDYSKIGNLARGQKRDRAKVDSLRHHVSDDAHTSDLVSVDLARLTKEVVEGAISAHRHSRRLLDISASASHAVSVTLDIKKRESWITAMTPGTWVRILNNIIGGFHPRRSNRLLELMPIFIGKGLKYTSSGVVSVKLSTTTARS